MERERVSGVLVAGRRLLWPAIASGESRDDRHDDQDRYYVVRHDPERGEGDDLGRQYQGYQQPEHSCYTSPSPILSP